MYHFARTTCAAVYVCKHLCTHGEHGGRRVCGSCSVRWPKLVVRLLWGGVPVQMKQYPAGIWVVQYPYPCVVDDVQTTHNPGDEVYLLHVATDTHASRGIDGKHHVSRLTTGCKEEGNPEMLKYTGDVSLLLKQKIRIYKSTVIFHTGPGGHSEYYAGLPWHYMPNFSWLPTLTILSINFWSTCTYFVYYKSKKELNYDRFVDLNILVAARLLHSDIRMYRISFFLLDIHNFSNTFPGDLWRWIILVTSSNCACLSLEIMRQTKRYVNLWFSILRLLND